MSGVSILGLAEASRSETSSLVFIHGFLDEGSFWSDVIGNTHSASPSRTIAPDLLGMGSQRDSSSDHGLPALRDFVLQTIAGLEDPLVLVGHSMGAQIAELAATALPDKVAGLVLISPVPLGGLPLPDDLASAMRKLGGDGEAQRQMRSQLAVAASPAKLAAMVAAGLKVRPDVVGQLLDAWSQGLPAGREPTQYSGPVLIIGGAEDGFTTPELLRTAIAPRFPQAELEFVDRAGHWPHMEQPIEIASRIDRFLATLNR
jgi:pimeloyl-ACP methyl ester carboxylesterase